MGKKRRVWWVVGSVVLLMLAFGCTSGPETETAKTPAVDPPAAESAISPTASLRVTALRYDSESGVLTWGEKWEDWEAYPAPSPKWHRIVTLSPGQRTELSIPVEASTILDGGRFLSAPRGLWMGEFSIHDLNTGNPLSSEDPSEDVRPSVDVLYIDGENAVVSKFLGDYDHKLLRAKIGSNGVEVGDVLVDLITMIETSGSPGLVSMSADGNVVAWTNAYYHYDRISWKKNGKTHTYMGDPLIESAILSRSGKYLYVVDRDSDDRVRVIDTTTEEVRLLTVYPFKSVWLGRDSSSDDVLVCSISHIVTVMSPEGHVKRVFNLLQKEGDFYWE